jgi:DNA helicase II / ATP-dependent DNA helicase PcrA
MIGTPVTGGNTIDDGIDDEIRSCLNLDSPQSFFLYAGAGSGKTRSLVNAVDGLRATARDRLVLTGKRIAVITYTNAACDEIKRRLEFDPLVEVSTIHSFAWTLIGGYNNDIRAWLRVNLDKEIVELQAAAAKGRAGTQAAIDRDRSIASKQRRLVRIETIKKFIYSPSGDNRSRDSLNHSEVIRITADFLTSKPILQGVLVGKFPVLFIDESQDTNKELMDAFLTVQKDQRTKFCLGLFGDVMQRIYADGKVHLENAIPADWVIPKKQMNHRCPQRVLRLINRVRLDADGREQLGRSDKPDGTVRLFIVPITSKSPADIESTVAVRMTEVSGDPAWCEGKESHKTLILEHHMAARRMGFSAMYEALNKASRLRTGLLDGSLAGLRLFARDVLPVVAAMRANDPFAVAKSLRMESPLLSPGTLSAAGEDQRIQLKKAKEIVDGLMLLWSEGQAPTFHSVLNYVASSLIFVVPESLAVFIERDSDAVTAAVLKDKAEPIDEDAEEEKAEGDEELEAWRAFLQTPFDQIEPYAAYVSGTSPFGTHQGVKGLEFPRVMVIVSDEEARGFLFSYNKLFGAKEKSKTDLENESNGNETSIDRTRRLFYVICSRAMDSLAIVAYTVNPSAVQAQVIERQWFSTEEVEILT